MNIPFDSIALTASSKLFFLFESNAYPIIKILSVPAVKEPSSVNVSILVKGANNIPVGRSMPDCNFTEYDMTYSGVPQKGQGSILSKV